MLIPIKIVINITIDTATVKVKVNVNVVVVVKAWDNTTMVHVGLATHRRKLETTTRWKKTSIRRPGPSRGRNEE